jgi:GMP synthase (glutamine-hydrolysing)
MAEKIIILDFGSQVTQLIARRIRETQVYCEIHPFNHIPELDDSVKGIILSGSPCSVREADSPRVNLEQFGNRPIRYLLWCAATRLFRWWFCGGI